MQAPFLRPASRRCLWQVQVLRPSLLKVVETEILNKHCAKTRDICLDIIKNKGILGACRKTWHCLCPLSKSVQCDERRIRLREIHLRSHGSRKAPTSKPQSESDKAEASKAL